MEGAEAIELAPSSLDLPYDGDDRVILRVRCYVSYFGHFTRCYWGRPFPLSHIE